MFAALFLWIKLLLAALSTAEERSPAAVLAAALSPVLTAVRKFLRSVRIRLLAARLRSVRTSVWRMRFCADLVCAMVGGRDDGEVLRYDCYLVGEGASIFFLLCQEKETKNHEPVCPAFFLTESEAIPHGTGSSVFPAWGGISSSGWSQGGNSLRRAAVLMAIPRRFVVPVLRITERSARTLPGVGWSLHSVPSNSLA
jgi:hypothetical protein